MILPSPMRPVRAISTILRNDLVDSRVVDPQRNLDLGQKGERVLAVAILVQVTLLPAVAFHFADAARLKRRAAQTFEHFFH